MYLTYYRKTRLRKSNQMTNGFRRSHNVASTWIVISTCWASCTGRTFVQSRMPDAEAEQVTFKLYHFYHKLQMRD